MTTTKRVPAPFGERPNDGGGPDDRATLWPGPTPDGIDVPGELVGRFPLGTQVVADGRAPAVVSGFLQTGGGRLVLVAHTPDGRRWTAPVGDARSVAETRPAPPSASSDRTPFLGPLVPAGPPRRRYVRLCDRVGATPPERLVVDGRRGEVVGTEPAYVVRLEDGTYLLLSHDDYRAAVEEGRADAEAVHLAVRERLRPRTVITGEVV